MSITKRRNLILTILLAIFSFLMFGCKENVVEVEDISFKLQAGEEQIVLLVNDFFEVEDIVQITPTYATDKSFTIESFNENVVRVVGNQIKAVGAGTTTIKVVSKNNNIAEDFINVTVCDEPLTTPELTYNQAEQTLTWGSVTNASSYTLELNGIEINMGQKTTYNLESFSGVKFDTVINARVRANAQSYASENLTSDYSAIYKFYQQSDVENLKIEGGFLSFTSKANTIYDVYINDVGYIYNATSNMIDLRSMRNDFAGQMVEVKVIAKLVDTFTQTLTDANVNVCSSYPQVVNANVLGVPELKLVGTTVSWENIAFASGYEIYLNGVKQTETLTNQFDLKSLSNFEDILDTDGNQKIKVLSVLADDSVNLLNTQQGDEIIFAKLPMPTISLSENGVVWSKVEKANGYAVTVNHNNQPIMSTITAGQELYFGNFDAGNYEVTVQTLASSSDINYIPSNNAKIEFVKNSEVQASISEYVLSFSTIIGETYSVHFEIDDDRSYTNTFTATTNNYSLNLSNNIFKAGEHVVEIVHLGNRTTTINSKVANDTRFTQLTSVDINISNSIASVTRSEINSNANIELETWGGDLVSPIVTQADSVEYNTTDTSKAYLKAGVYYVVAYVKGNGSTTFSYRDEDLNIIACDKTEFKVLAIPTLNVRSTSENKISVSGEASTYTIYNASDVLLSSSVVYDYSITIASGETKQFKARANGNGSTTLSSVCSNLITVSRLNIPLLNFDRTTNLTTAMFNNDSNKYSGYLFTVNGDEIEYSASGYSGIQVGDNNFELTILANNVVDGVYYLNSLPYKICVHKYANTANFEINENNELVITTNTDSDYAIKFDFESVEAIANGTTVSGLNYTKTTTGYKILLLGSDYNLIKPEMVEEFGVQIRYFNENTNSASGVITYYANSAWSEMAKLSIKKLSNNATIYTNENNQIIIQPISIENRTYLDLQLTIDGTNYNFIDNGNGKLVCNTTELSYEYSAGKYIVTLYSGYYDVIDELSAGDTFTVAVKFKKTVAGSDIDSKITHAQTIKYLSYATIERYKQNIKFTSVERNYDLSKFNIVLDGSYVLNSTDLLALFTIQENAEGYNEFTADINDLYTFIKGKIPDFNSTVTHYIQIVTLNTASSTISPLLGSIGEKFYIQQATGVNVSTVKENGLTYVMVTTAVTEYEKTYKVYVGEFKNYNKNDASNIKIELDSLNFGGQLNIYAYVDTNFVLEDENGNFVNMFNSANSNTVAVSRLVAPSISVENNQVVINSSVSGATSYEIYKVTSLTYEKIAESSSTRISLSNMNENEEYTIAAKAVTTNQSVLNSAYSSSIKLKKLSEPSISVNDGLLYLTLPNGCSSLVEDENVNVALSLSINGSRVYNCTISTDYSTNLSGLIWDEASARYSIASELVFDYLDSYLVEKQISAAVQINGIKDEINYLHTDTYSIGARGLFTPTDVRITKSGDGGSVDKLSWSENPKNKLSETASLVVVDEYIFVLKYNGTYYYSNDSKLMYKENGAFYSYGTIENTSVVFPYGYDENEDGTPEILFQQGEYLVAVRSKLDGYVNSAYSAVYSFTILPAPELGSSDGVLTWTAIDNANYYVVTIKDRSGNVVEEKVVENSTMLDFESITTTQTILFATVRAITSNEGMLNSLASEQMTIYRLPTAKSIAFNDGKILITTNNLIYGIKVLYGNVEYIMKNDGQKELLENATLLDFLNPDESVYVFDLSKTNSYIGGVQDNIVVQILGNNGTVNTIFGKVCMLNSHTQEVSTQSISLLPTTNSVTRGKWTFGNNGDVGSDDYLNINYVFNDVTNLSSFWINSVVYKLELNYTINLADAVSHTIIAVDYNRFMVAKDTVITTDSNQQTYYELCNEMSGLYARIIYKYNSGELVFNVFKDNIIDLQDYDNLYYYQVEELGSGFTSPEDDTNTVVDERVVVVNLSEGGSFNVKVSVMGGDVNGNVVYLNSPQTELETFVRYGQNAIATKNGKVIVKDLSQEGIVKPIYKINIYELNTTNSWTVYLYDEEVVSKSTVQSTLGLTASNICVPIVYVGDGTIEFDMSKYINAGVYRADVRTLAGISPTAGISDYVLNAKEPVYPTNFLYVLTSSQARLVNGNVQFNLGSYNIDGVNNYSYTYEITISNNGSDYVYEINNQTEDVVISGNTLTYTIPNAISGLGDITSGKDYSIKVRALTNVEGVINAGYYDAEDDGVDDALTFTRESSVTNVRIEDGLLKWVGDIDGSYIIKLKYFDPNRKVIVINSGSYVRNGTEYTYTFTDADYTLQSLGTKVKINPGFAYFVSVSKIGDSSNVISGQYVEVSEMVYRLSTINADNIKTNQGLLTWDTIEDATGYTVTIIGTTTSYVYTIETGETTNLNLTKVAADNGMFVSAGEYSVTIRANGNEKLQSFLTTATRTFTKLNVVTGISMSGSTITWNAVEGASGYKIKLYYNGASEERIETTNSTLAPTNVSGEITMEISAYAGNDDKLINSDIKTATTSTNIPNSVTDFGYNEDLNRFEWKVQSDFLTEDLVVLSYEFIEYSASGDISKGRIEHEIAYQEAGRYDNGIYYYPVTIMGEYSNISIYVRRANTLNSATVTCQNQFVDLFNYGAGTVETPYVITSEGTFANIKYYPNSYFIVLNDITFINEYTGVILDIEFTGNIDGNEKKLTLGVNGKIDLSNAKEFALFRTLAGATIQKLHVETDITISFAESAINDDAKIGILAIQANNSTLQNVRIENSSITLKESVATSGNEITGVLYVAGMVAEIANSTVSVCYIDVITDITIDVGGHTYLAGISAIGSNTNINEQTSVDITVTACDDGIRYFGGAIAIFEGDSSQSKGVQNSTFNINMENINVYYFGGIYGYAKNAYVGKNTINGTISRSNITSDFYFGGVVASASSSILESNTVNASVNIVLSTVINSQFVGKVVGWMESGDNGSSIKTTYQNVSTELIANQPLALGLYGKLGSGVSVTNE